MTPRSPPACSVSGEASAGRANGANSASEAGVETNHSRKPPEPFPSHRTRLDHWADGSSVHAKSSPASETGAGGLAGIGVMTAGASRSSVMLDEASGFETKPQPVGGLQ